jgi:hypothetical protein
MGDETSNASKRMAAVHPNPWKEMTTFEQVVLIGILGVLVLFVICVSVFWSWKAVGVLFLAALLSRVPFLMLLQLAVVAFLILLFGTMVFSTF